MKTWRHVGGSLDREMTYRREGAFESTAIYVARDVIHLRWNLRAKVNGRWRAIQMMRADPPRPEFKPYRVATMCESADTASVGCAFPRHQIGTGTRAWPTGQFSSNNWFKRKDSLEKTRQFHITTHRCHSVRHPHVPASFFHDVYGASENTATFVALLTLLSACHRRGNR